MKTLMWWAIRIVAMMAIPAADFDQLRALSTNDSSISCTRSASVMMFPLSVGFSRPGAFDTKIGLSDMVVVGHL